jgi:hypothetical protein
VARESTALTPALSHEWRGSDTQTGKIADALKQYAEDVAEARRVYAVTLAEKTAAHDATIALATDRQTWVHGVGTSTCSSPRMPRTPPKLRTLHWLWAQVAAE